MEQRRYAQWLMEHTKFTLLTALLVFGAMARAQIQYSISEEQKDGAAVGNIAKDLGIDHRSLKERGFRIRSTPCLI
uniref:Cadherin N-terminal domain-containing protein n=1 Tax=Sinocyclocheilus rhinocerous TaxID=307959 RepID=A0A673GAZ0_9TELE